MDDARNSATAHGDILFKNYKIQSMCVYVLRVFISQVWIKSVSL